MIVSKIQKAMERGKQMGGLWRVAGDKTDPGYVWFWQWGRDGTLRVYYGSPTKAVEDGRETWFAVDESSQRYGGWIICKGVLKRNGMIRQLQEAIHIRTGELARI